MDTVVEIFMISEVQDMTFEPEKLERWNALVSGLGLSGQQNLSKGDKSPIPYLPMNKSMVNVFETLCPRKVPAESFDQTPIPLEILEQIALSKREEYFTDIEVWYNEKSPDPVVVGKCGYYYQSTWAKERNLDMDNLHFHSKKEAFEAGVKEDTSMYYNDEQKYLIGKWSDMKHSFEELKTMASNRFTEEKRMSVERRIRDCKRELEDLDTEAFNMFN